MHVLVTGASGFVGHHLTPALVEAGHEVRALVRDASRYDAPDGVEVAVGDLLDPASLEGVFEDVEAAYYLVHSMAAGPEFEERDRRAARNFERAASEAGVGRVVYLGGLGSEGDDLSDHLRSRREVERILRGGGYELTTLRAAVVVGAGSVGFDVVRQIVERLPVLVTPQWVRTPCQPIAVADVVGYLAGVLDDPATAGETYEVGGPEVLTYEEMMERTAAILDRRVVVVPVPVLTPTLSTYWVDLVTDAPREVVHPLIDGLKNPVVADDGPIRERVDVALTPFDDAVRAAVAESAEAR